VYSIRDRLAYSAVTGRTFQILAGLLTRKLRVSGLSVTYPKMFGRVWVYIYNIII